MQTVYQTYVAIRTVFTKMSTTTMFITCSNDYAAIIHIINVQKQLFLSIKGVAFNQVNTAIIIMHKICMHGKVA